MTKGLQRLSQRGCCHVTVGVRESKGIEETKEMVTKDLREGGVSENVSLKTES